MANLPSKQDKSSTELTKFEAKAAELFARGLRPAEIAKMKYPDDKKKRRALRIKLWRMIRSNSRVHQRLAETAHGEMAMALVPATRRLGKRASRLGKAQDVKLLGEMSGFHNPRVSHEHSGDISVTLNIPRPKQLSIDPVGEEIIDAEPVDEDE